MRVKGAKFNFQNRKKKNTFKQISGINEKK